MRLHQTRSLAQRLQRRRPRAPPPSMAHRAAAARRARREGEEEGGSPVGGRDGCAREVPRRALFHLLFLHARILASGGRVVWVDRYPRRELLALLLLLLLVVTQPIVLEGRVVVWMPMKRVPVCVRLGVLVLLRVGGVGRLGVEPELGLRVVRGIYDGRAVVRRRRRRRYG